MTYAVVNAVQEITEFLATSFFGFLATGDSICTPLQLFLHLRTVRVVATFLPQHFLRILHAQQFRHCFTPLPVVSFTCQPL